MGLRSTTHLEIHLHLFHCIVFYAVFFYNSDLIEAGHLFTSCIMCESFFFSKAYGKIEWKPLDLEVGGIIELCRTCVMPFVLIKRHK